MTRFQWRGVFLRLIPFLVAGILIAIAAFLFIRPGEEKGSRSSLPEIVPGEGVKLKEVRYRQDDPDKGLKWALDASEVVFSEDNETVLFKDYILNLEPAEKAPVSLKGRRGRYHRKQGIIFLDGEVEAESRDGYRLLTHGVTIDEKARLAESNGMVKGSGPFFTIDGTGLFIDLGKRKLIVKKDVVTSITKQETAR